MTIIQISKPMANKIQRRLLRFAKAHFRRVVSFLVAMTFMYTMTGLDAIIAYAYDDYKQYSGSALEVNRDALMSGTNPMENAAPEAFLDISAATTMLDAGSTGISDTSMNVLKSEFGDLLDTVSLQTLSEKTSSGMSVDMIANMLAGDQMTQPDTGEPVTATDQETALVAPTLDPEVAADVITMQSGPLGMSLDLDTVEIPDTSVSVSLPGPTDTIPVKTDIPVTVETVETVTTPATDTPLQTTADVTLPDTQLTTLPSGTTGDQTTVQTNQPDIQDQTIDQVIVPETDQTTDQTVVQTDQPDQTDQDSGQTFMGNLSQQFMALLGMETTQQDDTLQPQTQTDDTTTNTTVLPDTKTTDTDTTVVTDTSTTDQNVVTPGGDQTDPSVIQPPSTDLPVDEQPVDDTIVVINPDQGEDTAPPTDQPVEGEEGDTTVIGNVIETVTAAITTVLDAGAKAMGLPARGARQQPGGGYADPSETDGPKLIESTNQPQTTQPDQPTTTEVDTGVPVVEDDTTQPVTDTDEGEEVAEQPAEEEEDGGEQGTGEESDEIVDTAVLPTDAPSESVEIPETPDVPEVDSTTTFPDQVLTMLGAPPETPSVESSTLDFEITDVTVDLTVPTVDLGAPDLTTTEPINNTLDIPVDALFVDESVGTTDIPVAEPISTSPVLTITEPEPTTTDIDVTVPIVSTLTIDTTLPDLENAPVQNTNLENNDQGGICLVGPDAAVNNDNQVTVQPVEPEGEVTAASLLVQPTLATDPTLQGNNVLLASTSPLNSTAGYTPVNYAASNVIGSLPTIVNQGVGMITATQPMNNTFTTGYGDVRPQILPPASQVPTALGMAAMPMPMTLDMNMQGYTMMGSMPASGTIGNVMPTGPPSIAKVVAASVHALETGQAPPRLDNPIIPADAGLDLGYEPIAGDDAWAAGEEYHNMYDHPDPPKQEGKSSGCAKFMSSFAGKVLMFAVTVVLTIFTVGTAVPLLLAIILILEAVLAFVPLPPKVAIVLSVLTAALGGWASAVGTLAAAGTALAQAAVQVSVAGITALFKTLITKGVAGAVWKEILKRAIAKFVVTYVMMKFPNLSPVAIGAIAIVAGLAAGGLAELITNPGGGVMAAFKAGFNEALGGVFVKETRSWGAFLTSSFAMGMYLVLGEAVIVMVMKEMGYAEGWSQFIGSIGSAMAVGVANVVIAPPQSSTSGQMAKFTALVIMPTIATAASTAFSLWVAPLYEEQGYSSVQYMGFAQTLGDGIRLFTPMAPTSGGSGDWGWTPQVVGEVTQLMDEVKNRDLIYTGERTLQAAVVPTAQEVPDVKSSRVDELPKVELAPEKPTFKIADLLLGNQDTLAMPALAVGMQKPVLSMEPAVTPKLQEAFTLMTPGLNNSAASSGLRLIVPNAGPDFMMPPLQQANVIPLADNMYVMLPQEMTPLQSPLSVKTAGNYGVGPGGNFGSGVFGASASGPIMNLNTTLNLQNLGNFADAGAPSPTLSIFGDNLSALNTDQAARPMQSTDVITPLPETDVSKTTANPDTKIGDVGESMGAPADSPEITKQETSPQPKPSQKTDAAGDSSAPKKTAAPETKTDLAKPAVDPNNPPSSSQTSQPKTENSQAPVQAETPPQAEGPQKMDQPLDDGSLRREVAPDPVRNDTPSEAAKETTQVKDLKQGDVVKMDEIDTPKGAEKNVTAGSGDSAETTEDTAKNNNRILENSGDHSAAFVPAQAADGAAPQVNQVKGADVGQAPDAVNRVANKLTAAGILPKGSDLSYSQTQGNQGQLITKVFNQSGQLIGAEALMSDYTTVTKTFDYQSVGSGADSAVMVKATTHKVPASAVQDISTESIMQIKGDELNVITAQPSVGAAPDAAGPDATRGQPERRDSDVAPITGADGTPKGPGTDGTTSGGPAGDQVTPGTEAGNKVIGELEGNAEGLPTAYQPKAGEVAEVATLSSSDIPELKSGLESQVRNLQHQGILPDSGDFEFGVMQFKNADNQTVSLIVADSAAGMEVLSASVEAGGSRITTDFKAGAQPGSVEATVSQDGKTLRNLDLGESNKLPAEAVTPATGKDAGENLMQPKQNDDLQVNIGSEEKPISAEIKYNPDQGLYDVDGSDGNRYRVQLSSDGEVVASQELVKVGNWWKSVGAVRQGNSNIFLADNGEIYQGLGDGNFERVASVHRASFTDPVTGEAKTFGAQLPDAQTADLPSDVKSAMVLAANGTLQNPDISAEMALAMSQNAVNTLSDYAAKLPAGSAEFETANSLLFSAAEGLNNITPNAANLATMANSARGSGDAALNLRLAKHQMLAGDNAGAMASAEFAYDARTSLPTEGQAEITLQAAQTMKAAGNLTGAGNMLVEVSTHLNQAIQSDKITGHTLALASRYNDLMGSAGLDMAAAGQMMDTISQSIASKVAEHAPLLKGETTQTTVPDVGIITKNPQGGVSLVQPAIGDKHLVMNFGSENGTLVPESMALTDMKRNPLQVYEQVDGSMKLTHVQEPVVITMPDGTQVTQNLLVRAGDTSEYSLLTQMEGKNYILDVSGAQKTATAIQADMALDAPGALSDMSRTSLGFAGDRAFAVVNGVRQDAKVVAITTNDLKAMGMELATNLLGQQAYQASDGTMFIGTRAQIVGGDYKVVGLNDFADGSQMGYVLEMSNSKPVQAQLSDQSVVTFADGNFENYTRAMGSADGTYTTFLDYRGQEFVGAERRFNMGAQLQYDTQGVLQNRSVLEKGGEGFEYQAAGQGFMLVDKATGQEHMFSADGQQMLLSEGPSTGAGQQLVQEDVVKQAISLNFSLFNSAEGATINLHNMEKVNQVFQLSADNTITRVITRSDFLGGPSLQTTEAHSRGKAGSQGTWAVKQAKGTEAGLAKAGYWPSAAYKQNQAGPASRVIQTDQNNFYSVGVNNNQMQLMGVTENGSDAFATISADGTYSFGAKGTRQQLDEVGLKGTLMLAGNRNQGPVRQILGSEGSNFYTIIEGGANKTLTLQGKTDNGADGMLTRNAQGEFTYGATGTEAQLNELNLKGSQLLTENSGRGAQQILAADGKNRYTAVERGDGTVTLQGKTANGADGMLSISVDNRTSFGATGTAAQLDGLGLKGTHMLAQNAKRGVQQILSANGKDRFTIIQGSDATLTLQGKTANGADGMLSLNAEGKISFGATGTEKQLNGLNLQGTKLLGQNAGRGAQKILPTDGKGRYTIIQNSDATLTLQGKTANGADGMLSLNAEGKISFGATGTAKQLDQLGLKGTQLLGQNAERGVQKILAADSKGRYTVIQSSDATLTLQGKTANGADAMLSLNVDGKISFGATGTVKQLDELGLQGTLLLGQNAERGVQKILAADGKGRYTIIQSSDATLTLQGKTANGADAMLSRNADGKISFGATGTVKQLDELGLKGSQLLAENADRGVQQILAADSKGRYTVVQSGEAEKTLTLQGKTANGADAMLSLNADGKINFGATGTKGQLDELGLKGSQLLAENADRGVQQILAADGKGRYTVVQSGDAEKTLTLQGKTDNGADGMLSIGPDGKMSFGATGTVTQLNELGLKGTQLLAENADRGAQQILAADGKSRYTVIQSGDAQKTVTLQGKTDNGADGMLSISADGKISFGATGTVKQLNELGLQGTEMLARNAGQTNAERVISAADSKGRYTIIESGETQKTLTLQGKTANGADGMLSLGADGKFTFGATGTKEQLNALGLMGSEMLSTNASQSNQERVLSAADGKDRYTIIESGDAVKSHTLQGKTANGADGMLSRGAEGKFSFGATGTRAQLNKLGLKGNALLSKNTMQGERKILAADGDDRFTIMESGDAVKTHTLQGKTANGADGMLSLGADGKLSFGATGTKEQLDALDLKASGLLIGNAAQADREILPADGKDRYTIIESGDEMISSTLQGKTANGADGMLTLSAEGKFSFGATGTQAQLDELGLNAKDLLAKNAGQGDRKLSATDGKTRFTIMESGDIQKAHTLQGKTGNGADGMLTLGADGKFSFGATGTKAQLNELGLKGSEMLAQNAQQGDRKLNPMDSKGRYTVIESGDADKTHTLQGKTGNGADGMLTRNAEGEFNFGATGTAGQLDELGLNGSAMLKANQALSADKRVIATALDRYTVIENTQDGKTSSALQGLNKHGASVTVSVEGDQVTFSARGTVEQLRKTGLPINQLLSKNNTARPGERIQAEAGGIYSVVENESGHTLQGKLADGRQASLTRSKAGEYSLTVITQKTVVGADGQKKTVEFSVTIQGHGSMVVINQDQEHGFKMGKNVQITQEGDKLLITDSRGVKEVYNATKNRLDTGTWQKVKNVGNRLVDDLNNAWTNLENRMAVIGDLWNMSEGFWQAAGVVVLGTFAAIGNVVIWVAEVMADYVVAALDLVGIGLGATVKFMVDHSLQGMLYSSMTGESLGTLAIDGATTALTATFGVIEKYVFQPIQEFFLEIGEYYTQRAEMQFAEGNTVAGIIDTVGAVLFTVIGENAPLIIMIGMAQLMGPAGAVMITLMLTKDAMLHGIGGMFHTFFVEPFIKIGAGLGQVISMGSADADISRVRVTVRGLSTVGGGVVGLMLARQMTKAAFTKARGAARAVQMEPVRAHMQAKAAKPGGLKALLEQPMHEVVSEAMGFKAGSKQATKVAKTEWGQTKVGETAFETSPNAKPLNQLSQSGVQSILTSKSFKLSDINVKVDAPKTPLLKRAVDAALRKPKVEAPKPHGAITEVIKASDIGMSFSPKGLGAAIPVFATAFAKHQVDMFVQSAKAIKSFAGRAAVATRPLRSSLSASRPARALVNAGRTVAKALQPSTIRQSGARVAKALRPASIRAAATRARGNMVKTFNRINTAIKVQISRALGRGKNTQSVRLSAEPARSSITQTAGQAFQRVFGKLATGVAQFMGIRASSIAQTKGRAQRGTGEARTKVADVDGSAKPLEADAGQGTGRSTRGNQKTVEGTERGAKTTLKDGSGLEPALEGASTPGRQAAGESLTEGPAAKTGLDAKAETTSQPKAADTSSRAGQTKSKVSTTMERAQTKVADAETKVTLAEAKLSQAMDKGASRTEIRSLEVKMRRAQTSLQKAQASMQKAQIADLRVELKKQTQQANDPKASVEQRAAATLESAVLEGKMKLQTKAMETAQVEAEISALQAKGTPEAKAQVEALKGKLETLAKETAQVESHVQLDVQAAHAKAKQVVMQAELSQAMGDLQKASTPRARKHQQARVKRLQGEVTKAQSEQKVVEAQKKVLDIDVQINEAMERGMGAGEYRKLQIKRGHAQEALTNESVRDGHYEGQLDRAAKREINARTDALIEDMAMDAKIGFGEMKAKVRAAAKANAPRGNRQAVANAMAELVKNQAGNPAESLNVLEQAGAGVKPLLKTMAKHGMGGEARKIFDQLCQEKGVTSDAMKNALAKQLGIEAPGARVSDFSVEQLTEAMNKVFGTPGEAGAQYRPAAEAALKNFGNDLRQGRGVEQALRRNGDIGDALKRLETGKGGKARVQDMIKQLTPDQITKLLTSTNPAEMLKNLMQSKSGIVPEMAQAKLAETQASEQLTQAKAEATKAIQTAEQATIGEIKAKVDAARQQAKAERLGRADAENLVKQTETTAKTEAAQRVQKVKAETQTKIDAAQRTLNEAQVKVAKLESSAFTKIMETNPSQAKALIKRQLQIEQAGNKLRQANEKFNQATDFRAQQKAAKTVEKAAMKLARLERLAEVKPAAGRGFGELAARFKVRGGADRAANAMLPETLQVKAALAETSEQIGIGRAQDIKRIMDFKQSVEKKVQQRNKMDAETATREVNDLMTLKETATSLREFQAELRSRHAKLQGENTPKARLESSAKTLAEATKIADSAEQTYQGKLQQLQLNKGDIRMLEQYGEALGRADLNETIERTWNDHYKSVYEEAAANGKLEAYNNLRQQFDAQVGKALDAVTPETLASKGGTAFYEKYMEVRQGLIESGKLQAGSAAEVTLLESYMSKMVNKITGFPDLRLSQKIMISDFLQGKNVGLRAGGGKTLPFIMFSGMMRMLKGGSAMRSELLVDDAPAIQKYLTEPFGKTGLTHTDLAKAMGIELVNGNKLYMEAQKSGNFRELVNALNSPTKTVVFDHTTRAHLRNAAIRNMELRTALGRTNLVAIDEVHMPTTSQTNAIIGGKVSKVETSLVESVDGILKILDFKQSSFDATFKTFQATGKAQMGSFEIVRIKNLTNETISKLNVAEGKTIVITENGVFLNRAAQKALVDYKGGEISSTIKTLFSQEGKAGELNSYAMGKDGNIYPVDFLGKIQFEQISNDIVGQVVAARKANVDPFSAVRVNETSMQTSLSAMYAGNFGAHIVGASGTIAGLENLMKSKVGSGSRHLSTSLLDIQRDVHNTGGKILTSPAEANRIVIESITELRRNALVFEADPAKQLELVSEYMGKMVASAKGGEIPVVSAISAGGTGYYVKAGDASGFVSKYNLRNAKVLSGELSPVKGLDYIEVPNGIQLIVENAGRIKNQVIITNEQGAIGKNYQADLTLVARGAHKLTADMFTQLLLRTGRPGGDSPAGTWRTQRYVLVDPVEIRTTIQGMKTSGRMAEIVSLWKADANNARLTDGLKTIDPAKINFESQSQLAQALKLNSEYRQTEMVGNSTRFAVQDTFKDKILIEPLKEVIQNGKGRARQIVDAEMNRVLNDHSLDADLTMKLRGTDPATLNRQYVQGTFMSSLKQASRAWGFRGILGRSLLPQNFFFGGHRLVGQSLRMQWGLFNARRAVSKINSAPATPKSFADIGRGQYVELFEAGMGLMKNVLSSDPGSIEAARLKGEAVDIQRAVQENRAPTRAENKGFQEAWQQSRSQLGNLKGYDTATVAQAAQTLGVDNNTARMALAPTYQEARGLLQADMLAKANPAEPSTLGRGVVMAPEQLPNMTESVTLAGTNRVGAFLRRVPILGNWIQGNDMKAVETQRAVGEMRETAANYANETWQQEHAEQVTQFVQAHGENWVQPALVAEFGPDVTYLQAVTEAKVPGQRAFMTWRQPARAQQQYVDALRSIYQITENLPALYADRGRTLTYRGETMNLEQALGFVDSNLVTAQSMAGRYGFQASPEMSRIMEAKYQGQVLPQAMQQAVTETIALQNPVSRVTAALSQKWQNVVRSLHETQFIVPLFKIQQGMIVPTKGTSLFLSAAALAALSFSSLPLLGLAVGMFALPLLEPLMKRLPSTKFDSPASNALGKANTVIMPLVTLGIGVITGNAFVLATSIGSIANAVVNRSLRAPEENKHRVVVNEKAEAKPESLAMNLSTDQTVEARPSLVETWKSEMGERTTGETAFNKLQDIMSRPVFGHVRLSADPAAHHYGYMHLIAAVFSLVPKALDSVSAVEVGTDGIANPENVVGAKDLSRVRVDKGSIRFLDQRFPELLLTQAIMAVQEKIFTDTEAHAMVEKLRQSSEFKQHGEWAMVELMKQYLLDGPALKARIQQAAAQKEDWATITLTVGGRVQTLDLYSVLQTKLDGREFREADLVELNQAMGELENEAIPLMQDLARQIQQDKANQAVRQTEFFERFGIAYDTYQKMVNPSRAQQLLFWLVGKDRLESENPVTMVQRFGQQLTGLGAAIVVTSGIVLGIVGTASGIIPVLLIGAAALTGLAIGAEGVLAWLLADRFAFSVNPGSAVTEQMQNAGFGFKNEQQERSTQRLGIQTLQLLDNRTFSQAVSGIKIPGTQMVSEHNRNRAIREVLSHLVQIMESDVSQSMKIQLTREATQVLGFLQFDIKMAVKRYQDELSVTLTPEVQSQSLKQDYKIGRLIQRLQGLGVGIKMEIAPPAKQPKLKLTGAAA